MAQNKICNEPHRSSRHGESDLRMARANVHTVNITINQYSESKPMEEDKINKMINESIKSIAKMIESSSNGRKPKIIKKNLVDL